MNQLYARRDRSVYRVFEAGQGDVFKIMDLTDFDKFQGYLKRFNMSIIILEQEEEPPV